MPLQDAAVARQVARQSQLGFEKLGPSAGDIVLEAVRVSVAGGAHHLQRVAVKALLRHLHPVRRRRTEFEEEVAAVVGRQLHAHRDDAARRVLARHHQLLSVAAVGQLVVAAAVVAVAADAALAAVVVPLDLIKLNKFNLDKKLIQYQIFLNKSPSTIVPKTKIQ